MAPIVCYLWIWKLISNHFQISEPPEVGWTSGLRTGESVQSLFKAARVDDI